MRRATLLPAAACVLIFLVATAFPAGCKDTPEAKFIGDAVLLTEGSTAEVAVGAEFAVALEENPSTGYSWSYTVRPPDSVKETAKESFYPDPQPMIGAPVVTVWKFGAVKEGEATLTFLYYRPWEKPETAVDKKVFRVKIVR
jgi:predicted secreted protein